ncbi:MAG TPA: tyrosine-type recombinase/integrase [Terriglobia bacterium]|nr:tyrosine-type recombinase/integrase [Terriglobia bacterium]
MRKRHQEGSLTNTGGVWIAQWWENGHRRKKTLGRRSELTKSQARLQLAQILSPINARADLPSAHQTFGDFLAHVYFPFYKRKWKSSTADCNEDRIRHHLLSEYSRRELGSIDRHEVQALLDRKAQQGLSFSTVDHLRWDLTQIFNMALTESYIHRNPAALLFTPRETPRPNRLRMGWEEVKSLFSVLDLRELLIAKLAVIAGMRPGEIFALKWLHVKGDHLEVVRRIYRGKLDSPKTHRSVRLAALSDGLQALFQRWKDSSVDLTSDGWVFPSERGKTPLAKDNCWRRHFAPKLKSASLEWVNFHVMRRTHSSLMREQNVDPKLVADQLGHSLDVNLNVYTETALRLRKQAANALELAIEQSDCAVGIARNA